MMSFTHDCERCVSLGSYVEPDGTPHDLYIPGTSHDLYFCGESVLARYGSEGHEYKSSLASIVLRSWYAMPYGEALKEALRRYSLRQADESFSMAVAATLGAYELDAMLRKKGSKASDDDYKLALTAHREAALLHFIQEPNARFHASLRAEHEERVRALQLCVPEWQVRIDMTLVEELVAEIVVEESYVKVLGMLLRWWFETGEQEYAR